MTGNQFKPLFTITTLKTSTTTQLTEPLKHLVKQYYPVLRTSYGYQSDRYWLYVCMHSSMLYVACMYTCTYTCTYVCTYLDTNYSAFKSLKKVLVNDVKSKQEQKVNNWTVLRKLEESSLVSSRRHSEPNWWIPMQMIAHETLTTNAWITAKHSKTQVNERNK